MAKGDSFLYCGTITINGVKYVQAGHAETKALALNCLQSIAKHRNDTVPEEKAEVDETDLTFAVNHDFVTAFADKMRALIPQGETVNDLSPEAPAKIMHQSIKSLKEKKADTDAGSLADQMK